MTEKPITSLSGDQWLKLIEAEKAKILQIDFAKDIKSYTQGQTYLEDAQKLYLFDAFSASVKEWNSLREQCVEIAFTKLLYPMLRKELRYKLTREAKDGVINECRGTLYEWLKVGRFNDEKTFEEEDEDDWGSKDGCRIMGIMYENGKFLTFQYPRVYLQSIPPEYTPRVYPQSIPPEYTSRVYLQSIPSE